MGYSRNHVIVLAIIDGGMTQTQAVHHFPHLHPVGPYPHTPLRTRRPGRLRPAFTLTDLNTQLANFHTQSSPHTWRVRYDLVDDSETITLRYQGKLLGSGRAHKHTRAIALANEPDVLVPTPKAEIIAEYALDPTRTHHRKTRIMS